MLSDKQQSKLKKMLIEQKRELVGDTNEGENEMTAQASLRDSTDELSTIDNHPADLATELFEREKDMALKVHHEDLLTQVESALERLENGSYGVCAKCQVDIPYDRLRAIPYTAFCIEHTDATVPTDRPVEEEVLLPPVDNSFSGRDENTNTATTATTANMPAAHKTMRITLCDKIIFFAFSIASIIIVL